jgi:MFS transporter, FHS family, glucose/mannose:H+ symporter
MNTSSSVLVAVTRCSKMSRISSLVLALGFSLTGAGTIMLGVLLPVLAKKWGLADDKCGLLLFLQFLGSSLGAVFNGADRIRSLIVGYGLLVVSACALAFAGLYTLFVTFFFFGLGLGMAMTATSLLFSDRYGENRAVQLERLNFAWSAGAAAAPMLLLPFLHGAHLRLLFFVVQALFLLILLGILFRERAERVGSAVHTAAPLENQTPLARLLPLVLLAVCAVGVEGALSGWLTTYSHRASPGSPGEGAFATALFMFGVTFSRLAFSTRLLAMIGRYRALRAMEWGVAASLALLIAGHHALTIDLAAALSGLSVGPLYPLLLSFLLERSPRGWIFAVAGLGSAIFPWLTGLLSGHFGSLRYGLAAPCAAAVSMIALSSGAFPGEHPSGPAAPSVPAAI